MDAQPRSVETLVWGWISSTGKPCNHTYPTPDKAVEGMQSRVGRDYTMEDLLRHGFRLALLRQTITPVMVMEPVGGNASGA